MTRRTAVGKKSFLLRPTTIRRAVWVMCLSALSVFCLPYELRGERLPVRTFTSADGLGSSFISYTLRDSHGFMWFCTRDGLSRFDGSRFITYQVGNGSAPGIEYILETRAGIYWITTTGGIYRFDPQKPIPLDAANAPRPTLNAEFIAPSRGLMFEDHAGTLWIAGGDLSRVEEKDGKYSIVPVDLGLPEVAQVRFGISGIFGGQDNSVWLLTSWGMVRRLPDGRTVFYGVNGTHTDPAVSATEDAEGRIWIGRSSGVFVIKPDAISDLDPASAVTIHHIDDLAVLEQKDHPLLPQNPGEIAKFADLGGQAGRSGTYVYQTSDRRIWIAAGNGVIEFDGGKFTEHPANQGLGWGLGNMIEDPDGNLWLTWTSGIRRLDRRGFTSFNELDGMKNPTLGMVGKTREGDIFSVSSDYSTTVIDDRGLTDVRPPIPLSARAVWMSNQIFQDSWGEWWVLTNETLYRFAASTDIHAFGNARPAQIYADHQVLKGQELNHVFEDSRRDLWISMRDGDPEKYGLARFNHANNSIYNFSEKENFPSEVTPSAFAEDHQGNLWFGLYEGGLLKFSNGRFAQYSTTDGLPDGVVSSLLIDQRGRLWIGTALQGLGRIDDTAVETVKFVHLTTGEGLASNNVRTLVEDNFGNIYVGTARGVDRFSPDGARIRHFTVDDGLAGDFVHSSVKDKRGDLWFATPSGLSKLVPVADPPSPVPQVMLGSLRVAGENRPVPLLGTAEISGLELAPAQNSLQIDFFAIDFHPNESLRFQVMLEGADPSWNAPTDQRTINYSNLSPGTYRLLVRAVNADGIAGDKPAVVSFRILPPVWRRWWFISLAVLFVGAAVFGLDRYRVTKTKQVESALAKSIESETRFRTLAGTASDAIITIDTESRIVFVNDAVEKIFGYAPMELIGQKLTKLMPDEMQTRHDHGLHHFLTTDKTSEEWTGMELSGRHKSGATVPLDLSFGEFELKGQRYFTGVARDITERKRAEEALERARAERLAELERVRLRIAHDLHDDVGSSLTQIALFSEVAKQKQGGDSEASGALDFLVVTSNDLVEAMSDIVWAINPHKDHLHDLTQRMRHFAAESMTVAGIDLEFSAPTSDAEMGANLRREVFLIFKESVNNVVKHAAATLVQIEFSLANDLLTLSIRDNGQGFDTAAGSGDFDWQSAAGGNGLISMKRRAKDLGGDYRIESKIGEGTSISLRIPLS